MIRNTAILTIKLYQVFISTILKNLLGASAFCRFPETCSAYTKRSISEHGLLKGLYLGFIRLLKCQPFYSQASGGQV